MPSKRVAKRSLSIRATLMWWLLPLAIVFMALAWLIHGQLLDRMAQDFVRDRLNQEASFIQRQILNSYPDLDPQLTSGHYFEDVFHHAYAIRIGDDKTIAPNRWTPLLLPLLDDPTEGMIPLRGGTDSGFPEYVMALRQVFSAGDQIVTLVIAEDTSVLRAGQAELHGWIAVVGLGLMGGLLALILLSINVALRPVGQLRIALAELQRGQRERLDDSAPIEFKPLIRQLNHVLDSLDHRLVRSRQSIANLSHSVKTPVAAVRQILMDSEQPLTPAIRKTLAARLTDIDRQLDVEMHHARFAGPRAGKPARPVSQARELVWMLSRLYDNKQFELETELDPEQRWPIEEDDFNELIGNLADNAGKWSHRQVSVCLAKTDETITIKVSDDGPGVDADTLNSLGTRGLRLDQQTPGHGLGLAIVRDLVQRYDGTLAFSSVSGQGLTVTVLIPIKSEYDEEL